MATPVTVAAELAPASWQALTYTTHTAVPVASPQQRAKSPHPVLSAAAPPALCEGMPTSRPARIIRMHFNQFYRRRGREKITRTHAIKLN